LHSDTFISDRHARLFWLPFLWGVTPPQHQRFVRLCDEIQQKDSLGLSGSVAHLENVLASWTWDWRGVAGSVPQPLEAYIRSEVDRRSAHGLPTAGVQNRVDRAIGWVWKLVAQASSESRKPAPRDDDKLLALSPHVAAERAIKAVM
jgi:hypothetical protein